MESQFGGGFVCVFEVFPNSLELSKNMVGWFHLTIYMNEGSISKNRG